MISTGLITRAGFLQHFTHDVFYGCVTWHYKDLFRHDVLKTCANHTCEITFCKFLPDSFLHCSFYITSAKAIVIVRFGLGCPADS